MTLEFESISNNLSLIPFSVSIPAVFKSFKLTCLLLPDLLVVTISSSISSPDTLCNNLRMTGYNLYPNPNNWLVVSGDLFDNSPFFSISLNYTFRSVSSGSSSPTNSVTYSPTVNPPFTISCNLS